MKITILVIQWSVGVFLTLGGIGGLLSGDFPFVLPCLLKMFYCRGPKMFFDLSMPID